MAGEPVTRFRIPETVLFRELDGEAVVLDLTSESYFGLDAVGTRMWLAVTESGSVEEALLRLQDEYDVDADTLEQDLTAWVERLAAKGLLREEATTKESPDA